MFDDEDTIEILSGDHAADPIEAQSFEALGVEVAGITHRGLVRERNEDQYSIIRRMRTAEVMASSLPPSVWSGTQQYSWLLAVADGLGGQVGGEVASRTAMNTLLKFAFDLSSWVMHPTESPRGLFEERVELYAHAIQEALDAEVTKNPNLTGMATTLTAAYLFGDRALIVGLGDSRTYLLRDGEICQITKDHTLGRELEAMGASPEATKMYHSVLTRCFTTQGNSDRENQIVMDMMEISLKADDHLLLCSDGLTDMVSDQVIAEIVFAGSTLPSICEQLVAEALRNGGRDNVTIAMARN